MSQRYRPPGPPEVAPDGTRRWTDLAFAGSVCCDVVMPAADEPAPAVLWVHGGGWANGDRTRLPYTSEPGSLERQLLAAGVGYVPVDYRLTGTAPFPANIHDVKAAVRYLRRFHDVFGIDPARIGAMGASAGGHLVSLLAVSAGHPMLDGAEGVGAGSTAIAAGVAWYGVHDFADHPLIGRKFADEVLIPFFDGRPEDRPDMVELASPARHVHPGAPPLLLVHGTADSLVPFRQSEIMRDAARQAGMEVELRAVPDGDHCFAGAEGIAQAQSDSVDWIIAHLPAQSGSVGDVDGAAQTPLG
jgi:acetyl esterase/lipase